MKVELSIADDRELRSHIKDVIKGEVVSVARAEIRGIIAEVVGGLTDKYTADKADEIARSVIASEVRKFMSSSSYGQPSFIEKEIRSQVSDLLRTKFTQGNIV